MLAERLICLTVSKAEIRLITLRKALKNYSCLLRERNNEVSNMMQAAGRCSDQPPIASGGGDRVIYRIFSVVVGKSKR